MGKANPGRRAEGSAPRPGFRSIWRKRKLPKPKFREFGGDNRTRMDDNPRCGMAFGSTQYYVIPGRNPPNNCTARDTRQFGRNFRTNACRTKTREKISFFEKLRDICGTRQGDFLLRISSFMRIRIEHTKRGPPLAVFALRGLLRGVRPFFRFHFSSGL